MPVITFISANSGRYFEIGSVSRKWPCSKRIMTATPVIGFDCE
jgi:hypothetical protein